MKKYTGFIETRKVGSMCEFEFEVEDDATEDEIQEIARETAFEYIDWNYAEECK